MGEDRAVCASDSRRVMRAVGVGDALGARLAERAGADAIWASGLAISLAHGVPDASVLTMTEFLHASRYIDQATKLPTICDCDTGFGQTSHVLRTLREYEAAGLAGVCLEDKAYPKRNSFDDKGLHSLEDANTFASRVSVGKDHQETDDFQVIARTEALVVGASQDEACRRGLLYARAGADMVLVHSKATTADEVIEFARRFRDVDDTTPLACVPTTYAHITAEDLAAAGFTLVIWANQASRAAVQAMQQTITHLFETDSSAGVEASIATVSELFDIGGLHRHDELELQALLRAAQFDSEPIETSR